MGKVSPKSPPSSPSSAKTQAQAYLDEHGIEKKLAGCVKQLLKVQPDNPFHFICSQLASSRAATPATMSSQLQPANSPGMAENMVVVDNIGDESRPRVSASSLTSPS